MGLVARFDFMPRVALNVFQQVPKEPMPELGGGEGQITPTSLVIDEAPLF
jgi:hypothetical protein